MQPERKTAAPAAKKQIAQDVLRQMFAYYDYEAPPRPEILPLAA
ncbi:MAG: hypothetical protein Q4G25_15740 [Paracoccus sp. (in: a-proteobacteria)]|nr:hypothetical protein [Paracoccus sp. (in: a-proteobacteria)]